MEPIFRALDLSSILTYLQLEVQRIHIFLALAYYSARLQLLTTYINNSSPRVRLFLAPFVPGRNNNNNHNNNMGFVPSFLSLATPTPPPLQVTLLLLFAIAVSQWIILYMMWTSPRLRGK